MTTQIKVGVIADNAVTSAKIAENSITAREVSSSASLSLVDLTLTGDLNITGDLNSLSVTDLDVADKTITLGAGGTAAANTGAGIIVDGASASILWDNTNTEWDFNNAINVTGNIGVSGTVDGRDLATDGSKLDGIESGATADQTQSDINSLAITEVGTISTGTWQGTAIADAYVADNLTISGGTIDNSVIGGTTAAAGTFTTITGTISTAAQTNITSVGTLSGLTVSGSGLTVNGDATFDTSTLVVDSTNNRVGIGTTSPSVPLDVAGKGKFSGAGSFEALELITSDTNRVYITGNSSVTGDMWRIGTSTSNPNLNIDTLQATGEMLFRINGTEKVRIDSSGNVGIGTNNPSRLLDIENSTAAGSTLVSLVSATDGNVQILLGDTASDTQGKVFYDNVNDYMALHANGAERLRINSSGNVGIGTTSPSEYLEFSRTAGKIGWGMNGNYGVRIGYFDDGGGDHGFHIDTKHAGTTTSESRFIIRADSGNIGIGTKSPSHKLTIAGNGTDIQFNYNNTVPNNPLHTAFYGGWSGIGMDSGTAGMRIAGEYTASTQPIVDFGYYASGTVSHANWNSKMKILSNGNVGIANTSPSYTLDVTGTINASTDVKINGASAATTGKAIAMALVFG